MTDSYLTLATPSEGSYTEKRSRFLAFAMPVADEDEVQERLRDFRRQYHDARHVCFAYALGADGERFRANDDGEPSGTAGRPILGQIRSHGLSYVLVVVVRYFGGIQLGAAGLGTAYKTAAALALENASTKEVIVEANVRVSASYPDADTALRTARQAGASIHHIEYGATEQTITFSIRLADEQRLRLALTKLHTLHVHP